MVVLASFELRDPTGGHGMTRIVAQHGLVVGKFYPPHLGHEYLIRTAGAHCERVTVAVLGSSIESISTQQRIQWLRESFASQPHIRIIGGLDEIEVDYENAAIWDAHVQLMRDAVRNEDLEFGAAAPVDAVFTSEHYGNELGRRFACPHYCLDQARTLYPTSGTAVRANLVSQWNMLSPSVQAGLALRVVVVGAESTGTTTLSRELALALQQRSGAWARSQWVAEYGREYSANVLALKRGSNSAAQAKDIDWNSADFVAVAKEQCAREHRAARNGGPVLICDTDAFATRVWHERYMGHCSDEVEAIASAMPGRALYLLTSESDVPFVDDGLRDGEHMRAWMTQRFRELLNDQTVPWIELHGSPQARCNAALEAIDRIVANAWKFSLPLEHIQKAERLGC
jgi:HTH-type transcriptional regulator, transcriptional repressor of NAD biosynthesis genes